MKRVYAQEERVEVGPVLNLEKETELFHFMLENKKRAAPKVIREKEERFSLEDSPITS